MARPRSPKVVSHAARKQREALRENLGRAISREYPELALSTAQARIESATGIALSTMQRIMNLEVGATIDTLADLARHLGTTVADLVRLPTEPPPLTIVRRRHPAPNSPTP